MLTFRDNSWYQSGNKRRCQTGRDRDRREKRDRREERERARVAQPAGRPRRPFPFLPGSEDSLDGRAARPRVHLGQGGRRAARQPLSVLCWGGRLVCLRLLAAGGGRAHVGRVLARWVLGVPSGARASGRGVTEWAVGTPLGGRAGGLGRLPVLLV